MTNKEAIRILKEDAENASLFEIMEAVDLACKALETIDKINFNIYALNELIKEEHTNEAD